MIKTQLKTDLTRVQSLLLGNKKLLSYSEVNLVIDKIDEIKKKIVRIDMKWNRK